MKYINGVLAAASLFVVTGTIRTAQADNDTNSVTLYTSAIHTGVIACNAINVSKKTLKITISIFDGSMTSPPTATKPTLLEGPTEIKTPPGMEATIDYGTPVDSNEGYCVFQVSGTSNRDDVRAVQNAVLAGSRTVDVGGVATTFPFFITRVLEAH
jgi:hypothetical protein